MSAAQHTPGRYALVNVRLNGYSVAQFIGASGQQDACRQHVAAWRKRVNSSSALVLRLPHGGRMSVRDSEEFLKATRSAS